MTNAYSSLDTLKSAGVLNLTGNLYDGRLLALLETASRWIEGYCNRQFYAAAATRIFDGNGRRQLPLPDLIATTALQTRPNPGAAWTEWAAADYQPYPADAGPRQPGGRPYRGVAVSPIGIAAGRVFPAGIATVSIAGLWGFGAVTAASGTTIQAGNPLTAAANSLTAAAEGKISAGQTLAMGAEQLYVTAVEGAAVSVLRGVNGTAAAAHNAETAIAVYAYPGPVAEAALQLAADWWHRRDRFALPGSGGAAGELSPGRAVTELLAAYRRLAVGGPGYG